MHKHSHIHSVPHAMIENVKDFYYVSKYLVNKKRSQERFGFMIFSHSVYVWWYSVCSASYLPFYDDLCKYFCQCSNLWLLIILFSILYDINMTYISISVKKIMRNYIAEWRSVKMYGSALEWLVQHESIFSYIFQKQVLWISPQFE